MHSKLIALVEQLHCSIQPVILGSAMIDLRMKIGRLPLSGEDALLDYQSMHLGGCAFNIVLALKRLAIDAYSALPIGKGLWANETSKLLASYGITSPLSNDRLDNGWCMALVESTGERTFLTVEGAETHWNNGIFKQIQITSPSIIYLSGYQLLSSSKDKTIEWLSTIDHSFQLVIDFGPRIEQLTRHQLHQLLVFNPLLTLNRQEVLYIAKLEDKVALLEESYTHFSQYWVDKYQLPLIIRLDQQGAFVQDKTMARYVTALPVQVKDTIGAGDSHTAGLIAGLAAGWRLDEATLLGNAIASYVVAHEGGDCAPTKEQLIQWLKAY